MKNILLLILLFTSGAQATDQPLDAKWKRLYSDSADASSFLKSNWNKYEENYHPNYVLDNDPNTAWVKGNGGDGTGETLSWRVSPLKTADQILLRIRNGYQKSEKLFKANEAVKSLEVSLLSGEERVVYTGKYELKQEMGWQDIQIVVPNHVGFSKIKLKILSVYPGTSYKDLCISDVQTYVQSKVPYNQAAEQAKFQRLQNWIKERVEAAKYFAHLPIEYPFASTHFAAAHNEFRVTEEPFADGQEVLAQTHISTQLKAGHFTKTFKQSFSAKEIQLIADLLQRAKALSHQKDWYSESISAAGKSIHPPEMHGAERNEGAVVSSVATYAMPSALSYFLANKAIQSIQTGEGDSEVVSNRKINRSKDGKIKEISYWENSISEERTITNERSHFLVTYDSNSRLENVFLFGKSKDQPPESYAKDQKEMIEISSDQDLTSPDHFTLVSMEYNDQKKISGMKYLEAFEESDDGVGGNPYYVTGRYVAAHLDANVATTP